VGGFFVSEPQQYAEAALEKGIGFTRTSKYSQTNASLGAEVPAFTVHDNFPQRATFKNEKEERNFHSGTAEAGPFARPKLHRRDALWQVERAAWEEGPLLTDITEPDSSSPLVQMTSEERLIADYHGTGLTVGPHPMLYRRDEMNRMKVVRAIDLRHLKHGQFTRIAGCVIARQRPGTSNGFIFLSLEDETGISNAIITPDLYDQNRLLVIHERFLLIEGILQNVENVISIKALRVSRLEVTEAATRSHDFH